MIELIKFLKEDIKENERQISVWTKALELLNNVKLKDNSVAYHKKGYPVLIRKIRYVYKNDKINIPSEEDKKCLRNQDEFAIVADLALSDKGFVVTTVCNVDELIPITEVSKDLFL